MASALHPADLIGTRPVFLLDLHWAGRVFRVATEPVSIKDNSGKVYSYDGGLADPAYEAQLDRNNTAAGEASVSLEVVLPGVDVAKVRRQGHDLGSASASIWMVVVNSSGVVLQTIEERWHLVTGKVRGAQYSDPERPTGWLACTVREEAWEDTGRLTDLTARFDESTYNSPYAGFQEGLWGTIYPTVIGTPGSYTATDGTASVAPGSPAYVTAQVGGEVSALFIAGHPVAASQVTLIDEDGTSEVVGVYHKADDRGRLCAWADVWDSGTLSTKLSSADPTDEEWWVAWDQDDGGLIDPLIGKGMEEAGTVILWALSRSTLPIDHRRWRVLAEQLRGVRVATYINDPEVTPWAWLEAHVLPLLPISIVRTEDGLAPVIFDPALHLGSEVAHFEEGPDFRRVGPWQVERDAEDIINTLRISYAPDGTDSAFIRRFSVVSEVEDSNEEVESHYSRVSVSRYGIREEELELDAVWSDATAQAVALDRVRLGSMPFEVAEFRAACSEGWLQVGQAILLTDSAAFYEKVTAVVIGRSWDGVSWRFLLAVDEDIVTQARKVG